MHRGCLLFTALLSSALLLGVSGCGREEPITSYNVKRLEEPTKEGVPAKAIPVRFLAAMAPGADLMWFFRFTGPEEMIAPHVKDFEAMVQTIGFEGGEPTYSVPKGWEKLPGKAISRGGITLKIHTFIRSPGPNPQNVEVTALPLEANAGPAGLKANLDRWRGMIGLPPVRAQDIPEITRTVDGKGVKITLVDMRGSRGMGGMGAHPPIPKVAELPFKADMPEDWVPLPGEEGVIGFRDFKGAVFYMKQQKPGTDWVELFNQLSEEIGLKKFDEAKIRAGATSLEVGKNKVNAVEMKIPGPEGDRPLLGVQLEVGKEKWIFVMFCEQETYARRRPQFQQFLATVESAPSKSK